MFSTARPPASDAARRGRQSRRRPRHVPARSPHAFRSTPQGAFACCTAFSPSLAALPFGAFALPALAANPQVEFDTTAGKIRVELYPDAAPKTVANFLDYVKAKHYDGTQFHRVIAGFMIQGGGFTADFKQKPTRPPVVERGRAVEQGRPAQRAGHDRDGAHLATRNSATAQFFINVNDNKFLNFRSPDPQGYGYTVFGKVVAGMDVVNKIAKAPDRRRRPVPQGRAGREGHHQQGLRRRSQIGETP